ncbi:hypothetical protein [Curtobacterium sp. Leaf183]|uniref:hypothetical protein n=1 Tax=Curtobacterium sp. Leaf183 TaxID=1736291 RepID=UPI0012E78FCD|nr:hypothetical protein [Curtobacterium sp. Leaf183]
MADAMTTRRAPRGDRFRVVQLLPAPATVLALTVAASHDVGSAPLGLIAIVGTLATVASAVLPMVCPSAARRAMPAPAESDRWREDVGDH